MKKYNLKSIMKNAWNLFRSYNAGLGCSREALNALCARYVA